MAAENTPSQPIQFEVTVLNPHGMHLRCCSEIARLLHPFNSKVEISNGERKADGKSMLGLTTLAAPCGSKLNITVTGGDAEQVATALQNYFANTVE